ncbi:DNA-binding transcriptional regulator, AcrR family [Thalassobacillus cyri]|uniref:DNA-binding transcriptional regulator, AcrR family n=1 Tax=Thalassobacillus cyri TaxID=571932 RepID=A0A1H4AMI8_9BACI|nr:TetR/AcrR family transcriptional regulator [Thalassobacillus cyri]SEA37120.1 DNA-binding transcriptional regulator, AcrR family [Thalassobacillus cyri]
MKENLLQTCIQLFEKKGFSETSIADIVHAHGVTKGTFYYYFTSKEQVLMTIHSRYIDGLIEQQEKIMAQSFSNIEKLEALIDMLIMNIVPKGRSARVFFRELRHLSDGNLREVRKKRDRVRYAMEEVIKQGIDSGEFRAGLEADIVTLGILGACNWSYQWFQPAGPKTDKEVATIYIDLMLNGMKDREEEYHVAPLGSESAG